MAGLELVELCRVREGRTSILSYQIVGVKNPIELALKLLKTQHAAPLPLGRIPPMLVHCLLRAICYTVSKGSYVGRGHLYGRRRITLSPVIQMIS